MAKGGVPLDEWSGSGATKELHQTIKAHQVESSRQTTKLIRLYDQKRSRTPQIVDGSIRFNSVAAPSQKAEHSITSSSFWRPVPGRSSSK
jgi:hypothetical protein